MERLLVYTIAAAGIMFGLLLYYYRPWPFSSRTYDRKVSTR